MNLEFLFLIIIVSCLCMSVISAYIEARQDYLHYDEDWLFGTTDKHKKYVFIHSIWYFICLIVTGLYVYYTGRSLTLVSWIFPILACCRGLHYWLHDGLYMEYKNQEYGVKIYPNGFKTDVYSQTNLTDRMLQNTYRDRKIIAIISVLFLVAIEVTLILIKV